MGDSGEGIGMERDSSTIRFKLIVTDGWVMVPVCRLGRARPSDSCTRRGGIVVNANTKSEKPFTAVQLSSERSLGQQSAWMQAE